MASKTPKIKIVERKLGREQALGQAWQAEGLIEIDPRLQSRMYLDTLIHELLHVLFPDASETKVSKSASSIARNLWRRGYRRIQQ